MKKKDYFFSKKVFNYFNYGNMNWFKIKKKR